MTEQMEHGVTVAGIWLPVVYDAKSGHPKNAPTFVFEKDSTPYNNLQQLALAVSCYRPVLLQGPVGSGKTSTVEYLAHVTGHSLPHNGRETSHSSLFLKVQLGEQTDARMLLGGYQCTEIPGQFIWKPGVLTQAVLNGHWLLLEDIDCTSSDVITVIDNLVKTQSLCVPGYSDNIIPHSQFQLFATQRTLRSEYSPGVRGNLLKHWISIQLNPLSHSEIVYIITERYPKLTSVANRIVSVLDLEYSLGQGNVRVASVRDILKWCNRCHDYFKDGSPESALRLFHDAVDIFCGFMDKDLRFRIAEQIGVKLGIVKNKTGFLNPSYKPSVTITNEKFVAGRSCLNRRKESIAVMQRTRRSVFSLTTQSCCLIEKISCCLEYNEPVLLVGETGCGKTTVLQYIASILGRTLVVINMNQQSDTADLLGGFKPVTFKWVMKPLCEKFEILFRSLFDAEKNSNCLIKFTRLVKKQNWDVLLGFIIHVQKRALAHIAGKLEGQKEGDEAGISKWESRLREWEELGTIVEKYSKQRQAAEKSLIFSFIEGSLITAMKQGHWVLLDEINLATSETLDCLSGLLEDSRGSIALLEKGDSQPVYRDSGFRLFAAMNPATDVGKKQLPTGLRNRFTELFIDELEEANDLVPLVDTYLSELNLPPNKLRKIVKFYLKVKKDSKTVLLDGNGRKPHYSLRNLCRALTITAKNSCGSVPRSLYEALSVSFLTQLDNRSYQMVGELISKTVTESNLKAVVSQPIPKPTEPGYVDLEGFWLPVGTLPPTTPDAYILTPTVQRHLRDLIKIVSLGCGIPVLLEGDTSVGKTSLINYLAKRTGNVCSRVNNHEHTDIQEYIGTYVADAEGKLVFKEGILCESMRKGHWLILDELNLAPTEVLEALNRVLDDNRELFIPETQVTIKAHEKFLLFATQNPPGLYGGRKELSRAFRNRFIELQFNQIPPEELVTILEKRCQMPLSYCTKMVNTMTELQLRRRGSDIFIGKSGFITLRDLFRWGERYQKAKVEAKFHDWDQHIADEGYILLAGRVRLQEESRVIEEVLCKHFKRKTNPDSLFSLHENTSVVTRNILEKLISHSNVDEDFRHIVWTYSMRRLAVLVWKALDFSEPVLIVGETGCGKTTVVQLLARLRQTELYSVNCHMHSESADFLGGLRPVRNESRSSGKFFEWCDGPLVQAMTSGSFFLADEISLADDSVLERLNSLLEPERTILLTEKGGGLIESENEGYVTVADEKFQFIGTMNPGGDYGKKELSPALRNRFTEIWADTSLNRYDCYLEIIRHNLSLSPALAPPVSEAMTRFLRWFRETELGRRTTVSVRDVLTWVKFINTSGLEWPEACVHGVCLTFLDGLGSGSGFGGDSGFVKDFKEQCVEFLLSGMAQLGADVGGKELSRGVFEHVGEFHCGAEKFGIHPFYIQRGKWKADKVSYVFNAPTTFANARRLLRGLKTNKAILLEGSPGVGKTSLVSALARAGGYKLARINLSDQTDISDLFGADLPEEGGTAGHFAWKDGPFLTALKEGQWILLDELNLASQSVLEGLNAVLDHRGSVYIPELNKTFRVSTETRLFGCQNPLKEGGNRRGLPKSFLNRFTQVYVEPLAQHDYVIILNETFPNLSTVNINGEPVINQMIRFNARLCGEVAEGRVGVAGGPWELNLRDMTRWAEGVAEDLGLGASRRRVESEERLSRALVKHMSLLYLARFRTQSDRDRVYRTYLSCFGEPGFLDRKPQVYVTREALVIGENVTDASKGFFYGDLNEFEMIAEVENGGSEGGRKAVSELCSAYRGRRSLEDLRLLEKQFPVLSSLCLCVNMNWFAILVGGTGTGKTNSVRTLAALKGRNLRVMSCNSAMDTTEILGGFEQTDYNRHLDEISESARVLVLSAARRHFETGNEETTLCLLRKWKDFRELPINADSSMALESFNTRLDYLERILKKKELKKEKDLRKLGEDLLERIRELRKSLMSADCLTFGGKFEWVDSILVKSLKDGSWLLMEDVNLCSNAVLDRLNCLLEPGGSLTIGERGAVANGELVTVTPHPNFRLFFTMDPKNGTISRAMRNRGVEIYLLPDSGVAEWPRLDVLSLLNDSGVSDMETQKALMEVESNSETESISALTANGFWTAQYVRHKFGKAEAFQKSSKLVYKLTECGLVEELSLRLGSDRVIDISLARPPLSAFLVDPGTARLKQSVALLRLLTESSSSQQWEAFGHLFGCDGPVGDVDVGLMAEMSLLHMLLTTSGECAKALQKFLPVLLGNGPLMEVFEDLVKVVPDSGEFPWDTRWFENVSRLVGSSCDEENNKLLVLLSYLRKLHRRDDSKSCTKMTVERYSKSVQEGSLEDSFANEPIVSNFTRFLSDFDGLVVDTLKCDSVRVSEAEAKWFLNVMKWRFRLGQQGKLTLLTGGRRKTLNEDTLTLLELHLSWFLSFVVKTVRETSLTALQALPETLRRRYTHFSAASEKVVSSQISASLVKMSNVFRSCLGHPPPTQPPHLSPIEASPSPAGDPTILHSILIRLLEYINLEVSATTSGDATFSKPTSSLRLPQLLPLLTRLQPRVDHARPLLHLLQDLSASDSKEARRKMASQMAYHSLRVINAEYHFLEEVNEASESAYARQVLPFHRPVWTCRVLRLVFDWDKAWNLSTYQKCQSELSELAVSVLPNSACRLNTASGASLMDARVNDQGRLSLEVQKVVKSLKKCLGVESEGRGLVEVLSEKGERSSSGVERSFYSKVSAVVRAMLSLRLDRDSELEVVGCFWTLLGLLELLLLREGKIDPIRKKLIKAGYAQKEVTELETEIKALEFYSAITGVSLDHFYATNLRKELATSRRSLLKYSHLEKVERSPESFRELCREVESFMTSFDDVFRFVATALELFQGGDVGMAQHLYLKGRCIRLRNESFSTTLEQKFLSHFRDLTYPLLAASCQIEHGVNVILSELLRRPCSEFGEVEATVAQLCRFPLPPKAHLLSRFQKLNMAAWPREALRRIDAQKLLILFSSCVAKYNEWLFFRDDCSYNDLMGIFSQVVEHWKKEDEKKKQEEMEKESLYLKRGVEKCKTTPEEEEFLEEQLKLFPTFEDDFNEETTAEAKPQQATIGSLTDEHFSQVSKMHMKTVKGFIKTSWCPSRSEHLRADLLSPIRMRFALLSQILPNVSYLLNDRTDEELLPGLLVLMSCKESGDCSGEASLLREEAPVKDFYRDRNVEEVSKCLEVLQGLSHRANELLEEWPDHPALVQIRTVIDRILTFSIDSPVMRFLTGLELLLQSCQHWESVAHSGVSIAEHLIRVTNLIIEWRKLELQGWKNCLQAAHERIKTGAFKWWFHFWCLVEEFMTKREDSSTDRDALLKALSGFVETSPLGEFDTRLEILLTYHYHVLRLPKSRKRDELSVALWNLYAFYQQFSGDVAKKLSDESASVTKKLKEFVGIAKWHDITYWSVKQAIEKSHRTLLKFIKEYEVVLRKKVELNAFGLSQRDHLKRKKDVSPNIDISKYLKSSARKEASGGLSDISLSVQNLDKKLEKARKYSNDVILTAEYPNLVLALNELTENICESTQHFAELDVDRSLPEEKRKAQAKSIVHQKRRALTDLFKTLQRIGLSYRAGLSETSSGVLHLCTGPPMSFSDSDKAEAYYLKTVFRKHALDNSLLTPSKEIGPQVIERLRGFSGHFMDLNSRQKATLCGATVALEQLRHFESLLTALAKSGDPTLPHQTSLSLEILRFRHTVGEASYLLQQFSHVLDSWPLSGSSTMKELSFLAGEHTPAILTASKTDEVYVAARRRFQEVLEGLSHLRLRVEQTLVQEATFEPRIRGGACEIEQRGFVFYTRDHVKGLEGCVGEYNRLMSAVGDVLREFSNESVSCVLTGCLGGFGEFSFAAESGRTGDGRDVGFDFDEVLSQTVGGLIESILLGIQRLVKKYKGQEFDEEGKEVQQEDVSAEEFGELLDNHLDRKLLGNLQSDLTDLNMDRVNETLLLLFRQLSSFSESGTTGSGKWLRILSAAVPFVKQYSVLCSYFVSQQSFCYRASNKFSSVLFGTFLQVAQKGYCAPPEFEEDGEGDGGGWNDKEGGGFTGGEGQGQKDVSDRIESEDQLEDARPEGSEKDKEQEKDCKYHALDSLITNLEELNADRAALQSTIEVEETERAGLEERVRLARERLAALEDSLARKQAARGEFDRAIRQGEHTVRSLLEMSRNIVELLRNKFSLLTSDDIMTPQEEENGIEMSENFEGKSQDVEEKGEEEEDGEEEEEPDDKEMGETEAGADKLESEMWSDSEDEEENKERKEEKGQGEQTKKDQYGAKDNDEENDESGEKGNKERKEKQKDINKMEEPEDNGDQVDPYHGHHEPEIEPEPLDLPDDLQLDDGDAKGDDGQEENPFDIDAMKEQQPPKEVEEEKTEEEKNEEMEESSGDEEANEGERKPEEMEVDEDSGPEEEKEEGDEGGRKREEERKPEEEEKKQREDLQEEFHPSDDKPCEVPAQPAPDTKEKDMSSADNVVGSEEQKQEESEAQEAWEASEKEPRGVGQAEMEQTKQSHEANMSRKEKLQSGRARKERERKRERPGKSDEDRCLGDAESRVKKKLRTLERVEEKEEEEEGGEEGGGEEESDVYQHVSERVEEASQVLDAATKDQAESQALPSKEEEEGENAAEDEDMAMDVDEEDVEVEEAEKQKSSEVDGKKPSNKNPEKDGEVVTEEVQKQIEGEVVKTLNVQRGPETTFHTRLPALSEERSLPLQPEEIQALRLQIQEQLSSFSQSEAAGSKGMQAWHLLTSVVEGLARDLSEQLRLILEPTRATRLKGDYRTGRRINMRKVIAYIASEFRKDSIWLRRSKPWKREHEIVLAIDDSSSMAHNESRELAFESLALVFKALGLIEAGQLGVLSFGERTKVVHRPGDPFSDETGARIIQDFSFEQNKTLVCEMLEVSTSLMTREKRAEEVARLLMIISDGRGVFSEGVERVKTAVRRATDSGIFVVFVVIDNPKSRDSIMDIRMPEFQDGKFIGIKSYMESFPFPYYLILRDIAALPNTLSDALRQWFQLISVSKG